jgi:hypothetical protein
MYDFIWHKLERIEGVKITKHMLVPKVLKDIHEWFPQSEHDVSQN